MAVDPDLRPLVNGLYDLQKVRISIGNRIVANFRDKLGIKSDDELKDKKKAKKVMDKLRSEYDRITDGIVRINQKTFKPGKLIGSMAELMMIRQYNVILDSEDQLEKDMAKILAPKELWQNYLKDVKGVGTKIASYILAYLDIYIARYPSSFHKYCGLDVVTRFYLLKRAHKSAPKMLQKRHPEGFTTKGPSWIGPDDCFELYDLSGILLGTYALDMTQPGEGVGRSRRKYHLRTYKYIDKHGEEKEKDGITFRDNLKTKMIGVLGPSLLKCKNDPYYDIYNEYKSKQLKRTDIDITKKGYKAHIHAMATRYMVKRFLTDLHIFWRGMEGLEVSRPWHEAKLGTVDKKHAA